MLFFYKFDLSLLFIIVKNLAVYNTF